MKGDPMKYKRMPPVVASNLRTKIIHIPSVIEEASGINVKGRIIRSMLFSTDLAIIRNHNADAIIAVYPFTPELSIIKALLDVSTVPVFAGVGGGVTSGRRSVEVGLQAELLGAMGVVLNHPASPELFTSLKEVLDIPSIATIATLKDDFLAKIKAGASILNVSGSKDTPDMVREIRKAVGEDFPIIATGGPTEESILETIKAGANTITYTPPSTSFFLREIMENYRKG